MGKVPLTDLALLPFPYLDQDYLSYKSPVVPLLNWQISNQVIFQRPGPVILLRPSEKIKKTSYKLLNVHFGGLVHESLDRIIRSLHAIM